MEIDHDLIDGFQWEVELAPVSIAVASEPMARPAMVLIVANGVVLSSEMVTHPPSQPGEIGALLADRIAAMVEQCGYAPPSIGVRFREVASVLRERLASLGIAVRCKRRLQGLDDAARSVRQEMVGIDGSPASVSFPSMWGSWSLPNEIIEEIFEAAAHYYRLHPWSVFPDDVSLALDFPGGTTWHARVLGEGGQKFGLTLFESLSDFRRLPAFNEPGTVVPTMESMVISLSFDARSDLPKPMRREIAEAKWPVAGSRAHPMMWTANTPGGGLTRARALELCAALRAVAGCAIAVEVARVSDSDEIDEWRDESAGIVVRYLGLQFPAQPSLWDPPATLTTSLAEGPRANPRALVDADGVPKATDIQEFGVLDPFRRWLRETGAPDTRVQRDVRNADAFLQCLVEMAGVRLVAITEYDLRVVLYDLYIRRFRDSRTAAMTMRGSLRRFFRFLGECEGIECPWARAVLRENREFEDRYDSFSGGNIADSELEAWQGHLYVDLQLRVLHPSPDLTEGGPTPGVMGEQEYRLWRQMHREWLTWRDEAIRGGVTDATALLGILMARLHEWEEERRPEFGGRTVREVMSEERNNLRTNRLPGPR